jgi:superoxide dismutase, Cu-Zn family
MMQTSKPYNILALVSLLLLGACGGPQKADTAMPATAAPADSAAPVAADNAGPSAAAASTAPTSASSESTAPQQEPLAVTILPRSNSKLKGTAHFEPTAHGVKVTIDVTDAPSGKHGAHIHQVADCSSKDAKSAGDHFNPESHEHGLPMVEARHLGDLGNLEVGKDGKGHLEITIAGASLKPGDKMSFLDRGIIIHEKVDDGGQPAGNAGARIGCGEIKR